MHNQRKNYFIDKKFQTQFILKFSLIVILAAIAIGISLFLLSINSTTVAIENTKVTVKTTADFILPFILQTIIVVTIFSALSVILLTLFVSHKIAGPLYRLKREIDKLGDANFGAIFQIRTTDQLKELSSSLTSMSDSLRDKIAGIKAETENLRKVLDGIYFENKKQVEDKVKRIESVLNTFKGI
ncbi:MAG: hypothetical protein M0R48_00125 [Candidatus Omnitrophica bacterium]|jgi:methyl-accepting chemotaxis protein|nr:hypothetical protein [Candidatus Omnitrophota bacterium]